MIFVDSDTWIGLHSKTDALHQRVLATFDKEITDQSQLVTSWETIDEVCTRLSYFTGKNAALEFLGNLDKMKISIIYLDRDTSIVARQIFLSQKSKNVSMTDCANMAIAKKLKINTFFSFDEHYPKNGFKLLSS